MNTPDQPNAVPTHDRVSALARMRQLMADITASPALAPLAKGSLHIALIQVSDTASPPPAMLEPTPSLDARRDLRQVLEILATEMSGAPSAADSVRLAKVSRHLKAALAEMSDGAPPDTPVEQP